MSSEKAERGRERGEEGKEKMGNKRMSKKVVGNIAIKWTVEGMEG